MANFFVIASGIAVGIHGQRRAAGGIDADADHLLGLKALHALRRVRQGFSNDDFRGFQIIGRVLPGEIGIAGDNDPFFAVRVNADGGTHFRPIGNIDHQSAHRVRAVIETDRVFRHVLFLSEDKLGVNGFSPGSGVPREEIIHCFN